jgi:hypothetical protein
LLKLIHGFQDGTAEIIAILDSGREIQVFINSKEESITCNLPERTPKSLKSLLGFMPPLGQIPEEESFLTKQHILRYINTPLASHHIRNHIKQLLDKSQQDELKKIIYETWNNVELGEVQIDRTSNRLYCAYSENSYSGEISCAGQGFQIWLQIITHMIRLSDFSTIVLDEPEIFLHPEKQHAMIHSFREYFDGSMIIATHSPELMNEVDFSHILYIQREVNATKFISMQNKPLLEGIRQEIGSSFNLIASQFEDVERLIFSENVSDYEIVKQLATKLGISVHTHNIPISESNKWPDCIQYKNAHRIFFGKEAHFSLLLDKDFYPKDHLDHIDKELSLHNIRCVFTPGHEIENIFIQQDFLLSILPINVHQEII